MPFSSIYQTDPYVLVYDKQVFLKNAFGFSLPPAAPPDTAETPYIAIQNPANSNTTMVIVHSKLVMTGTANQSVHTSYYANGNITVGSAITAVNMRVASGTPASAMVITSNPTSSSFGVRMPQFVTDSSFSMGESDLLYMLDPGNQILVTMTATATGFNVVYSMVWHELPFATP